METELKPFRIIIDVYADRIRTMDETLEGDDTVEDLLNDYIIDLARIAAAGSFRTLCYAIGDAEPVVVQQDTSCADDSIH